MRCWLVLASSAKLQNLISAAADQRRRKITLGAKYRRLRPHIILGDSVSTRLHPARVRHLKSEGRFDTNPYQVTPLFAF